jgi:hypothetical protein
MICLFSFVAFEDMTTSTAVLNSIALLNKMVHMGVLLVSGVHLKVFN